MSMENMIRAIIHEIGEPEEMREGLKETPRRVMKSWEHLFSGYGHSVGEYMTVFSTDGYDEIVLLKNIEFYSTCEHHMLPFYGVAHIAYLPDKKVVGISKLARILELYSRRLQIQERIGVQVVKALDDHLIPLGSACILEAKHFCMVARGVEKQNSIMTTSALTGSFKKEPSARAELMRLIK